MLNSFKVRDFLCFIYTISHTALLPTTTANDVYFNHIHHQFEGLMVNIYILLSLSIEVCFDFIINLQDESNLKKAFPQKPQIKLLQKCINSTI
jgi:hypothetical protein